MAIYKSSLCNEMKSWNDTIKKWISHLIKSTVFVIFQIGSNKVMAWYEIWSNGAPGLSQSLRNLFKSRLDVTYVTPWRNHPNINLRVSASFCFYKSASLSKFLFSFMEKKCISHKTNRTIFIKCNLGKRWPWRNVT